jgi:hypothetical protein
MGARSSVSRGTLIFAHLLHMCRGDGFRCVTCLLISTRSSELYRTAEAGLVNHKASKVRPSRSWVSAAFELSAIAASLSATIEYGSATCER